MSAEIAIGGERLAAHRLRAAVLGEVHARPFTPIETPRRVLHFAFETTAERGEADRAALAAFCTSRGLIGLAAFGEFLFAKFAIRCFNCRIDARCGSRSFMPKLFPSFVFQMSHITQRQLQELCA